jgi:hypothetical protein
VIFNESDRNYMLHTEASSVGSSKMKKEKKNSFFSYSGCFHFLCRLFSNGFFTTISNFKLTFSDFFFRGSCTKMNDCYV